MVINRGYDRGTMKHIKHYIAAVAALLALAPLHAAEEAPATPVPAVQKAVKETTFVTGTPMTDAQHYVYIFTASWCGPCLSIMPRIVEQYAEMKANKVEIIVIGCDRSEKMVKKYIEHYRAGLTAIYVKAPKALTFPGVFMPDAIPFAIVVDANGKVLAQGHASILLKWKELCGITKAE